MFKIFVFLNVVLALPASTTKCPNSITCTATRYDLNFEKTQCPSGCFANGCVIYNPNHTIMKKC